MSRGEEKEKIRMAQRRGCFVCGETQGYVGTVKTKGIDNNDIPTAMA